MKSKYILGALVIFSLVLLIAGCGSDEPDFQVVEGTDDIGQESSYVEEGSLPDSGLPDNQSADLLISEHEKVVDVVANKSYTLYENEVVKYIFAGKEYDISVDKIKSFGTSFIVNAKNTDFIRTKNSYEISEDIFLTFEGSMRQKTANYTMWFAEISFYEDDREYFPEVLLESDLQNSKYLGSAKSEYDDYSGEEYPYESYRAEYSAVDVYVNIFESKNVADMLFRKNRPEPDKLFKYVDGNLVYLEKGTNYYVSWQSDDVMVDIDLKEGHTFEDMLFVLNDYLVKYPSDLLSNYKKEECFEIGVLEKKQLGLSEGSVEFELYRISDSLETAFIRINGESYSNVNNGTMLNLKNGTIFVNDFIYDLETDLGAVEVCVD